ncbi:hypothetical protein [Klebsiella pneumoniae]|uniref:hypothetical protein n=1 Tax=Klebsiella pneumoniae TaxID=573 RepID=UPI001D0D97E1|nr:hypothetical protein [Klebsiella pneumoniae]
MTDITELAHGNSLRKKLNRRLNDAYGFQRTSGGKHTTISLSIAECKSVIAALDERLALVEALEKAQRYIEELREWNAGLAQESCERQQLISELEPIRAAAEKLVRCKGRYHSEQNYRALAALFGVTTPDLPPLDSESSAVTVKLTDINEFLAEVHDKTLNRAFRLLAEGVRAGDVAAMRAAGIKVEAE